MENSNKYDFNNKTFALVQNSDNGQVDTETTFKYKQDGDLVTADYFGGTIRYGKIIASLKGDNLNMLYQCLTTDGELKAGKALAVISKSSEGKIKLQLNWQWLGKENQTGESEYIEINQGDD